MPQTSWGIPVACVTSLALVACRPSPAPTIERAPTVAGTTPASTIAATPVATATKVPGTQRPAPTALGPTSPATISASSQSLAIDGQVAGGEYAHDALIGDVHLWWRADAKYLYMTMEAKTSGWVAVGLAPDNRMQGANYVIGAVANGQSQVIDAYGDAPVGSHPADRDLGGTADLLASAGVEENGVTRIEFQIPLDSGDKYDKALMLGQSVAILTAYGRSDAFGSPHSARAAGRIVLDK